MPAPKTLLLHPVLVSFPAALWLFGFACDVASLVDRENALWPSVAFYAFVTGVVAGFATGIPQWLEYAKMAAPQRNAARRQLLVGMGALALFSLDVGVRLSDAFGLIEPVFVSATGVIYLLFAPRLGGDPPIVRGSIEPHRTTDR